MAKDLLLSWASCTYVGAVVENEDTLDGHEQRAMSNKHGMYISTVRTYVRMGDSQYSHTVSKKVMYVILGN